MCYCLTSFCSTEKVNKRQALAIDTKFNLPVPVNNAWPAGKHNENDHAFCYFDKG